MLRENSQYDMVLMDHMMPQIDGVDTTKIIRNFPEEYFKSIPIIAFTANAVKDAQLMFLENGFNDFLAKPIEIKSLKQILLRWLPENKQIKSEPLPVTENQVASFEFAKLFKKIDVSHGITSCMGDIDSYKEILSSFAGACEKTVNNINQAVAQNKYSDFTTHVHAIKSSAKSIGAMELSQMAFEQEMAGKEKNFDLILEKYEPLLKLYEAVLDEVETVLEKKENATADYAEEADKAEQKEMTVTTKTQNSAEAETEKFPIAKEELTWM